MTNLGIHALVCACLAWAGGCAMPGIRGAHANWRDFTFIAAADMNRNSPVAVDVVLISSQDALEKTMALTAAQWFASRTDLGATFPHDIRYRSWEIVPGQTLSADKKAFAGSRVIAALVFANYDAPGAHRIRVDKLNGRVVATMTTTGFTLTYPK
ncbi:hypothetical protein OVY01_06935 [Robbsia sp. Bb-Pol-6]|uniref:Type VI secretion system protein n=1 Tax=Robbsia betulipollinis TaxID=2981849 RepID=A0ABT3ZKC9_9BURK|nr:hypothetical protein [Robbsia betulipollinis]MCY0386971.1 hypothetical protein [Robbsia betulipollinis]